MIVVVFPKGVRAMTICTERELAWIPEKRGEIIALFILTLGLFQIIPIRPLMGVMAGKTVNMSYGHAGAFIRK